MTLENSRIEWATTKNGVGMALNTLGLFEQTSKYTEEAEAALVDTLKVFTEDFDLIQWAFAHNNIGDVYWNRGIIDKNKPALQTALDHFAKARTGFERGGGQWMIPLLDGKVEIVKKTLEAQ